jgi:hypothetical protein
MAGCDRPPRLGVEEMSTTIATPRAAAGAVAPPVAGAVSRCVLPAVEPVPERAGAWLWTSLLAAILAAVGNAFALFGGVYDGQARGLVDQALAQDAADLALVAPALVVLALLALAGSLRAYVLWLGVLAFTVYSYAIYAFAIRIGPLFLLWVAVLGLAAYSFVGGIVALDHRIVRARLVPGGRAVTAAAWTLLLLGTLFALAWLREIVPAAVAGGSLGSAARCACRPIPCTCSISRSSCPPRSRRVRCCAGGGAPCPARSRRCFWS